MKRSLALVLFLCSAHVNAFSERDLDTLIATGNCAGGEIRVVTPDFFYCQHRGTLSLISAVG